MVLIHGIKPFGGWTRKLAADDNAEANGQGIKGVRMDRLPQASDSEMLSALAVHAKM